MVVLYGIPNCDKVRAARKWLTAEAIEYRFHDFRKDGITPDQLEAWVDRLGLDTLINRRGTTWRQLPEETRSNLDPVTAVKVMQDNPSVIKRPILEADGQLLVGFTEDQWREALQS
ncbi:ArsC family reductase [Marinobacteraceae bacterium S3BR75-40.1]